MAHSVIISSIFISYVILIVHETQANIKVYYTTEIMVSTITCHTFLYAHEITQARTSKTFQCLYCCSADSDGRSVNDILDLEVAAAGTQFAAGADSRTAFATLFSGNKWMIYWNTLTGVLHWDFVSDITRRGSNSNLIIVCAGSIYQLPRYR